MVSDHTSPLRAGVRLLQHNTTGDRYVLTPGGPFLEAVCAELAATVREPTGTFHVFSTGTDIRAALGGFPRQAAVAEEIPERAQFYTCEESPTETGPIVVTDDSVTLVSYCGTDIGFEPVETTYADVLREHLDSVREASSDYEVATPSMSHLQDSATDTFGIGFTSDLNSALFQADEYETVGAGDPPNPVSVLVLVAARNQIQRKTLARWCAQLDLATERTVYKHVEQLVNAGIVREEAAESSGRGRAPKRLYLTAEFTELESHEYPATVASYLS